VHKLLDMARLHTGKLVLNKEWQPLEEVVGSSLKAMAGLLGGREVRVELAPDLPPLEFDAVLLERVFCNLLENAAKYAPQGAIVITAQVAGEAVEVAVADAGPGLPPEGGTACSTLRARQPLGGRRRPWPGHLPRDCRGAWRPHPGGAARGRRHPHDFHAAAGHAAGAGGGSR
jgi:hypothetical protein